MMAVFFPKVAWLRVLQMVCLAHSALRTLEHNLSVKQQHRTVVGRTSEHKRAILCNGQASQELGIFLHLVRTECTASGYV
jgi:hypothetical protein